jgi:hypothetical protein
MRVSKNQVSLLAGAIAALCATTASAQVTLAVTGAATGMKVVASEAVRPFVVATGAATTLNTPLGIGISTNQQLFLRVRLSGATFAVAQTNAGVNATPAFAAVAVATGGTVNSSEVIFNVTANTNNNNVADPVVIPLQNLNVLAGTSAVTVTYDVHQLLSEAQAGTNVLFSRSGTFYTFSPALALTRVATQNSTISAASSYLNFSGGAAETTTRARIARVSLGLNAYTANGCTGVACLADTTTASTIGAIANVGSTANTLTVSGDFSAAAAATSVATNTATVGSEVASAITATSATIPLLSGTVTGAGFNTTNITTAGLTTSAGDLLVRYTVNGTTAVPESAYTTSLTLAPNSALFSIPALSAGTTGNFSRDGVALESPWVTATTGFISRFFITQTTPATVPYTVTVRNAAGVVTGTTNGTLASGRQTVITLASILPADTTAFPGPYQVTFSIAATDTQVRGSYVLTSPNGSVSNTPLYTAARQ